MLDDLTCAGCGILIGIGLVFLGMGHVSERNGDDCGGCVGLVTAVIVFLLAVAMFWVTA